MEIIYNWLLHNTGNEGNFLTILNVQRQTDDETTTIEVMACTKEFEIVNLLIKVSSSTDQVINLPDTVLRESHFFANDNQVVAYLSAGETMNDEPSSQRLGVYVFTPTSAAGGIY